MGPGGEGGEANGEAAFTGLWEASAAKTKSEIDININFMNKYAIGTALARGSAGFTPPSRSLPMASSLANSFRKATSFSKFLWRSHVRPGDLVLDATCGNGGDSLELARLALTPAAGPPLSLKI